MEGLFGKKVGMTRIFGDKGESIPVTVIEVEPNVVYQLKTDENDGYKAVQLGIGQQKAQRVNRALTGHFAKAKKGMPRFVGEVRLEQGEASDELEVGAEIAVDAVFEVGGKVDVVGTSIGKGFAGVIKRHGMKGAQTMSHGTHEYFRHAGSIGCRKFPGRVFKNKRMPGRMGNSRVMQEGLEVIAIRPEDKALLVRGSIPGPKDGYVYIRQSLKQRLRAA